VCGVTSGSEDTTYGSYLASNLGRKRYDLNIAVGVSQCRACNSGCLCSGPFNLCDSCIDDTWYKNPIENRCYKCDNICQSSDLSTGLQNHRINCCKNCRWDDKLLKPRCTTCRSAAAATVAQDSMNEAAGLNNQIQVVSWPDAFEVVNPASSPYTLCYRCDRPTRSFGGIKNDTTQDAAPQTADFDLGDVNREYKLPKIDGAYFFSNKDNAILYGTLPGDPMCTRCQIVTISKPIIVAKAGDPETTPSNDRLALNYIDCLSCQNGYELMSFNSTTEKPYKFTASDSLTTATYTWKITAGKSECRSCAYLIKRQDDEQTVKDAAGVAEKQRYQEVRSQYARRCARTDASATQTYSITQCGPSPSTTTLSSGVSGSSSTYVDYVQESGQADATERGPNLAENNPEISESQFATSKSQNYLSSGIYNRYLINEFVSGTNKVKEICVDNKYMCKRIKTPVNYTLLTTNITAGLKCSSCFDEHIMTTGQHCVACEPNKLSEGCIACRADGFTESDGLQCAECLWNNNATSQLNAAGGPVKNYQMYADGSDNNKTKCVAC